MSQVAAILHPSKMEFWPQHPVQSKLSKELLPFQKVPHGYLFTSPKKKSHHVWPSLVTLLPHFKADHISSLARWLLAVTPLHLLRYTWNSSRLVGLQVFIQRPQECQHVLSHRSCRPWYDTTVATRSHGTTHLGHVVPSRRPSNVTCLADSTNQAKCIWN